MSGCARPGCAAAPAAEFGVEMPRGSMPRVLHHVTEQGTEQVYLWHVDLLGRRWFAGDAFRACAGHAREVERSEHNLDVKRTAWVVRQTRGSSEG